MPPCMARQSWVPVEGSGGGCGAQHRALGTTKGGTNIWDCVEAQPGATSLNCCWPQGEETTVGTDLPGARIHICLFLWQCGMSCTWDLSQCLGLGTWMPSHLTDTSIRTLMRLQIEVYSAALAVDDYASQQWWLDKKNLIPIEFNAQCRNWKKKVLFDMQKQSLFRAFWTSQCFFLPCQAFNDTRKVSHEQHCQLYDFVMRQCFLFCLKPQLLETIDYVRISQLCLKSKENF